MCGGRRASGSREDTRNDSAKQHQRLTSCRTVETVTTVTLCYVSRGFKRSSSRLSSLSWEVEIHNRATGGTKDPD